jgi:biuret amidohydrolase
LVDNTPGIEIYPDIAPLASEHIIKKHRYSAFYGTDLDMILRDWGIDTVIISGTTTENCCHATARDALFNNYRVVFLSDATATCDCLDNGFGEISADEVHRTTLALLAASTADVVTSAELQTRVIQNLHPQKAA